MEVITKHIISLLLAVVCVAVATAADVADTCFKNLPAGCFVKKSAAVPPDQLSGIERRLGGAIASLSNTELVLQGQPLQVNIIDAKTEADASHIHETIAKMKPAPAFCLRRGNRVIEYVTSSSALATKASYELGFVPKPKHVQYRVVASVATVDVADYMVLNDLFNLLLREQAGSPEKGTASQITAMSDRFKYGNKIILRHTTDKKAAVYAFAPAAERVQLAAHGESASYIFQKPLLVQGIPYVTLTADIGTTEAGITPTTRKADASLLTPTVFWPADDPEIAALAKKITAGQESPDAKVEALLKWLAPGANIKFGGPVTGSRYGVKRVLRQGYGQCWDFADCFVTFCRASGVPCRELGGWLFGSSGHIWAEVLLDGKGWKQMDATGGGQLKCGIYHIPYFVTEDGEMPILYTAMPKIEIIDAQ